MKQSILVLVGAVVGGCLGHFVFGWAVHQNFYAMLVPGGLLGMGAGVPHGQSLPLAILCGVMALSLGIYTEWKFFPFGKDDSFSYFKIVRYLRRFPQHHRS